ncbi:hypothetical protein EBB59_10230 [Lysobacter pythonis]|uniref:DUF3619 family protein n=1 Tax=Solilutibacter pythonis TaxID=2483112 RepID=A0A3M2HUJ5_9GAMM|nr:hypothetical protein [Lysobacter pythonis]RMH89464.1 hypothetical protein EBB59_10230 [Lysobacter pythonis]
MTPQEHDFDQTMRQRWREAANHLDGRTRHHLQPATAIRAAQPLAPTARHRWPAGVALAGLALAAGLVIAPNLRHGDPASNPAALASDLTAAPATPTAEDDLLGRNPDFYAWLGSDEVRGLAME